MGRQCSWQTDAMLKFLCKTRRLFASRPASRIAAALLAAARDAATERRFGIQQSPASGYQAVRCRTWRRPTTPAFLNALQQHLGLPLADFRRRAESREQCSTPQEPAEQNNSLLLAGERALADPSIEKFLCELAAKGQLNLVYPDALHLPKGRSIHVLSGVTADVAGQACLAELRRRGIGCTWLSGSDDVTREEVPLYEACQQRTRPSADGETLDYVAIVRPLMPLPSCPAAEPRPRPLRILTYRWHVPHQYELFKLGAEFTLLTDLGESSCRWWDLGQRPFPENARFARWEEIDPEQFDLALLHFDEHILDVPDKDPAVGQDWGKSFRFLLRELTIPRIAICHGTPQALDALAGPDTAEANRQALVGLLSDTPVVVNSHQAHAEWRFRHARVIWQGFDPGEFPERTPPNRQASSILTLPHSAYALRPRYHGADLLEIVRSRIPVAFEQLSVPEPDLLLNGNAYARAKFAHYIATLHRYAIYFNPTLHSPMPRTRGEAMLCGLATVSATSHDVDLFIKNGSNGFHADTAEELADHIQYLLSNPAPAWKIAQAGRMTGIELFGIERFLNDWRHLIRDKLGASAI